MNSDKRIIIEEEIRKLEAEIGVPEKFSYKFFLRGDDWNFIITLHSFLEAALTQLIIKTLDRNELEDIISRLPMFNKIAFIKSLSLLREEARRYVQKISEIRNFYVHNINSTSLTLRQYLRTLDPNKLKSFIEAIKFGIKEDIKSFDKGGKILEIEAVCENYPRLAIFITGTLVIAEISGQIGIEVHKKKLEEYMIKVAEIMLPPPSMK